ncbi:hypothetical protein HNY73_011546, partial [Argiope bruennichi]
MLCRIGHTKEMRIVAPFGLQTGTGKIRKLTNPTTGGTEVEHKNPQLTFHHEVSNAETCEISLVEGSNWLKAYRRLACFGIMPDSTFEPGDIGGAAGYSGTRRVLRSRKIKWLGEIDGVAGYSGKSRIRRTRNGKEPGDIGGAAGYSGTRRVLRSREIKGNGEIDGVAGYSGKSRVRRTRNGKEPGDIGGAAGYSGTRRVLRSREIKESVEIDGVAGYS